jgi:hypothetical protein
VNSKYLVLKERIIEELFFVKRSMQKAEEDITPDCEFVISGSKISVKTLDLNQSFRVIADQLNAFIDSYFILS